MEIFYLILIRTIATFVEISQSNLAGGISTLIPFKVSGIIIHPSLLRSLIIINFI